MTTLKATRLAEDRHYWRSAVFQLGLLANDDIVIIIISTLMDVKLYIPHALADGK